MDWRTRTWRPTLRVTMAVAIAAMVAFTALALVALTWDGARRGSLLVGEALLDQVAQTAQERVDRYLAEPTHVNTLTAWQLHTGALDPAHLEDWFLTHIGLHPSFTMMGFAEPDGSFLMVRRNADGTLWTKRITMEGGREVTWTERDARRRVVAERLDPADTYDPRTRPWYAGALAAGGPYWTDIYRFFTDDVPGFTAAMPWQQGLEPEGVLAVDVSLEALAGFLEDLEVSAQGRAFLVDPEGRVIGDPEAGPDLPRVSEAAHPALTPLTEVADLSDRSPRSYPVEVAGERWLAAVRPVRSERGEWAVVVVAPVSDFLGEVERLARRNILAAVLLALLAILVSVFLAHRISRSLTALVAETGEVRRLRFDEPVHARSAFREVHEALAAFDHMKRGLRSLQKYMPITLVRMLLESGREPRLGGEQQEVTLLFTDIEGFTTLSEQLGPEELARRLGDYLGHLTREIEGHAGTVLHYLGDGIMAVWGAPAPVPDHPVAACEAALACEAIVAGLWAGEPDAPRFPTRFGLHTATVAVGHYGTSERMAYTALGDGVNLASRLEGLNRFYGTRILVSGATWDRLEGRLEGRLVDTVAVKGRTEPARVYEILGVPGAVAPDLLAARDRYAEGIAHYQSRAWDRAVACFREALALRPADQAAERLIARCTAYAEAPPGEEWAGGFVMETK